MAAPPSAGAPAFVALPAGRPRPRPACAARTPVSSGTAGPQARRLDLRTHRYAQTRWFFGAGAAVVLASVLRPLALDGRIPPDLDRAVQGVFLALTAVAALTRRPRFHGRFAGAALALYGFYVAVRFTRLR